MGFCDPRWRRDKNSKKEGRFYEYTRVEKNHL